MNLEFPAKTSLRTLILAGVSALALGAPGALAQEAQSEADDQGIEEILVTSTKRGAQRLQSVPLTVQAITDELLTARGVRDFADYAVSVPGLRFEDLGPGDKRIFIRGINTPGASTVGVYYDEAVVTASNKEDGGGRAVDLKMFDIERVEILKGPQGTLYGASSMSGTIRLITNKPDATELYAYVEAGLGGTRFGGTNWEINGMVNVPLVADKLAARIVAYNVDNSGFIDNARLGTNNINDEETFGGRVQLRWTPTDNFIITASATIQETDVGGTSRITPEGTFGHVPTPAFTPVFGGDLTTVSFTKDVWADDNEIYSLTAEYDAGWGTFLATTNWFDRDIKFNFDSTPILIFFGAPFRAITKQPQSRRIWSNEFRFYSNFDGPLQVVAGVLVQREKTDFNVQVIASDAVTGEALGPWDPENDFFTGTGIAIFGRLAKGKIDQEAFFGEVTFDISENIQATAGLRYFQSDQITKELETHPFFGFGDSSRPPILDRLSSDDKLTKKFGLSFTPSEDVLVYFTAAQGFRVGGVNSTGIPLIGALPSTFAPDSLWNYELAAKTSWLDNRLIVNASVFLIDWNNMQVVSKDTTGAFQFIANANDARVKGLEFELNYRPSETFEWSFGGSVSDAELTQDQPKVFLGILPGEPDFDVVSPGLKGDPIPNAPNLTLNGSGQYSRPLSGDLMGRLRLDWAYVGTSRTEFRPKGPEDLGFHRFTEKIGGYNLFNIRASVEGPRWTASAFIQNMFDRRARVDALAQDQDPLSIVTVRPRTIGVNVRYEF